MIGNGSITLGDSLGLHPWYIRANLSTEDTGVIEHPGISLHVGETHEDQSIFPRDDDNVSRLR